MIKFGIINNRRTGDGGFGPRLCEKCGKSSTVFLQIKFNSTGFILCNNCLLKGSNMVLDGIIAQVKDK